MSILLTSRHSLQAPRRTAQAGVRMHKAGVAGKACVAGVVASSSFLRFETVAFASRRCST
ncbi:MAG: hypothetical protein AUI84_17865 [Delftia sp. 13_1_40CM_3_66_6]|uniref:hypothetical protein n=1 Tax=Delftia acidovorans TaxID=80866 RepID=UPI0005C148A2|nr:hypothetical protein [Delftia sp.]MCP4517585.1 hypothetical protein [Delftia sp.]OLE07796.1 MAG: hypothetical protein AUG53_07790 [Delftia sp. 13_1_20CM_4_67_18]OLE92871.1 MAG: hypothetical protein AUI84_17865 [Delftia sp. 13_1_40CM_3_66_6]